MLLKFDVFFFIGFSFQYIFLVIMRPDNQESSTELWVHALLATPCSVGLIIVSYLAVRRENRYLMYATLLGLLVMIGYLLSKLADIYGANATTSKFVGSRNSLTWFSNLYSSSFLDCYCSIFFACHCLHVL